MIFKILQDCIKSCNILRARKKKAERHRRSALLFYSRVTTGMTMGLRLVFLNR